MKVEFKGGKGIEAALKALDIGTARKRGIAMRALRVAAEPIRDEWKRGVDVVSGDLKRSIKIGQKKPGTRGESRRQSAFRRGNGQDIVELYIGIDASEDKNGQLPIYSYIEEFGKEGQPANPAGRRAWESKKMEAFDKIAGAMWDEISKTAKREAAKTARLKK